MTSNKKRKDIEGDRVFVVKKERKGSVVSYFFFTFRWLFRTFSFQEPSIHPQTFLVPLSLTSSSFQRIHPSFLFLFCFVFFYGRLRAHLFQYPSMPCAAPSEHTKKKMEPVGEGISTHEPEGVSFVLVSCWFETLVPFLFQRSKPPFFDLGSRSNK